MREVQERRFGERAGLLHALHELREVRKPAIEPALHAAIEDVVAGLVRECILRELERRFLRRVGCRGRAGGAAAAAPIARRVQPEHRFALLEQIDHRIQSLAGRRLRDEDPSERGECQDRQRQSSAHVSSS
jgi:hypothetical protein